MYLGVAAALLWDSYFESKYKIDSNNNNNKDARYIGFGQLTAE